MCDDECVLSFVTWMADARPRTISTVHIDLWISVGVQIVDVAVIFDRQCWVGREKVSFMLYKKKDMAIYLEGLQHWFHHRLELLMIRRLMSWMTVRTSCSNNSNLGVDLLRVAVWYLRGVGLLVPVPTSIPHWSTLMVKNSLVSKRAVRVHLRVKNIPVIVLYQETLKRAMTLGCKLNSGRDKKPPKK